MNERERAAMQQALEGLNRAQAELRGITPTQDFSEAADALRAALAQQPEQAEPAQDERTTIADLRCAKWLDPECADEGACQSLKFKRPAEPAREPVWVKGELPPRYIARSPIQPEPVPTHRINSWGFCGVCRHDRIPGEGCARQECPDSPQQPEPAQEPVAWAFKHSDGTYHDPSVTEHSAGMVPLGPIRAQRPPLTDEEIAEATAGVLGLPHEIKVELARAIERKVRGEAE